MQQLLMGALLICLSGTTSAGQSAENVYYYKHLGDAQESSPSSVRYARHVRQNPDHSVTTEWIFISKNAIVHSESYLNGTPVGLWIIADSKGKISREMDYRFELRYTHDSCHSGYAYLMGRDTLAQHVTGKFIPPKLKGYNSIAGFLNKSLYYPEPSREAGIEGRVVLTMKLSKDGRLNDIMVMKSADSVLDAEAARVLFMSRDWEPATLNGKPVDLCITFPITFKLD